MMFGVGVGIGIGVGFCGDIIDTPTINPTRNAFMLWYGISPTNGTAEPVGVARPKAVGLAGTNSIG
jgi:hypothetical protein